MLLIVMVINVLIRVCKCIYMYILQRVKTKIIKLCLLYTYSYNSCILSVRSPGGCRFGDSCRFDHVVHIVIPSAQALRSSIKHEMVRRFHDWPWVLKILHECYCNIANIKRVEIIWNENLWSFISFQTTLILSWSVLQEHIC